MSEIQLKDFLAQPVEMDFYKQGTLDIARQLLGKTLVVVPDSESEEGATAGIIVETEGYIAPEDPACHAFTGRTKRNETMWGTPGHAYVYFTYGNHWMINVVTEQVDIAAAALIRALQPVYGLETMHTRRGLTKLKGEADDKNLTNGPGKLCQAMAITGVYNAQPFSGPRLYLTETPDSLKLPPFEIVETTRIGITRGVDLPWRYYVKANKFVSKF